jgi:hypothetical protein
MNIYIHQNNRPALLVDPDYFAEQSISEEVLSDAHDDAAFVRRIARAIHNTPQPSLGLKLDEYQAGAMVGIHMTAANLREADCCMGVYGNWAIMPFLDDENGFWVSDLESGAMVAGNLRMIGDLCAVRNAKLTDTGKFFEGLQAFVGWQLARPSTQIDVESFCPFGQQMLNVVERIRRQHQALN